MTESAAHVRVIEGNACVLEGCVRLPAFQHRRRQHIRSPTGSALANERQPEPAGRRIRSANPEFYLATLI